MKASFAGLAMARSSKHEFNYSKEAKRHEGFFTDDAKDAIPVVLLEKDEFDGWFDVQIESVKRWLRLSGKNQFKAGQFLSVPGASDEDIFAFCLEEKPNSPFCICSLFQSLPNGTYLLKSANDSQLKNSNEAAFSWALGAYKFDRYKTQSESERSSERHKLLVWPEGCDKAHVENASTSTYMVRDLISTPAQDMGPQHLEEVCRDLSEEFGADLKVILGDELLSEGYEMIHAVGRAAEKKREPRLIDMRWGNRNDPKVTLVGKGVCFDTGGLDIKPSAAMLSMKKDMGGAAQVIGLARMIMCSKLPLNLRVLIPSVENNIAGNSFRPGDILHSKNGKTTEIGNTDAEGRLILADCLVEACTESPDLLIDCATLTGAARVALGTDVPVFFCNNDEVANELMKVSSECTDDVWRLPLWEGYRAQLTSKVADLKNVGAGGYGGAITAALYLDEFVGNTKEVKEGKNAPTWIHLDFMAFNTASKPGKPEGGEAQGMRALLSLIKNRYSKLQ